MKYFNNALVCDEQNEKKNKITVTCKIYKTIIIQRIAIENQFKCFKSLIENNFYFLTQLIFYFGNMVTS